MYRKYVKMYMKFEGGELFEVQNMWNGNKRKKL